MYDKFNIGENEYIKKFIYLCFLQKFSNRNYSQRISYYQRTYVDVAESDEGAPVTWRSVTKSLIFADWIKVKSPCSFTTTKNW